MRWTVRKDRRQSSVISFGGMRLGNSSTTKTSATAHRSLHRTGHHLLRTCRSYGESEVQTRPRTRRDRPAQEGHPLDEDQRQPRNGCGRRALRRVIDEQLKRLRTDHLEFYQMWNIGHAGAVHKLMAKGATTTRRRQPPRRGCHRPHWLTVHALHGGRHPLDRDRRFESVTIYYNAVQRDVEPVINVRPNWGWACTVMGPLNGGLVGDPRGELRVASDRRRDNKRPRRPPLGPRSPRRSPPSSPASRSVRRGRGERRGRRPGPPRERLRTTPRRSGTSAPVRRNEEDPSHPMRLLQRMSDADRDVAHFCTP